MKALRLKRKDKKLKKKEAEASKLRMRKMREKKKSVSSLSQQPTTKAYSTPQSLGKAVRRIKKSLPCSPSKKQAVVEKIASDLGLIIPSTKPVKNYGLSKDTKECVKVFYYRDDITRQLQGKKDVKSVLNPEANKRTLLQKRLLMYNLKDAFQLFKIDHPNIEIGLSKFCELRPSEVETVGCKDQAVCCCPYCENFAFLLKVCKWKNNNIKTANDIFDLIVCNKNNADCMKQKCKNCPMQIKKFIDEELDLNEGKVCVNQWNKGKLEENVLEAKKIIEELISQLTTLLKHIYNISRQAKEIRKQKDSLLPGQLLMQIDFSQNYEIKHQNEVMAAHWKTDQDLSVTVYTAVVYFRRVEDEDLETKCYAVIFDFNRHTSAIVKIFNKAITEDIKKMVNFKITSINIWSDVLRTMEKGPHDGIGAVLKRHVWKKVLQGKTIIKNAFEFFKEVANRSDTNITCLFIEEKEILQELVDIENGFESIKELKGIQSCHCVRKTTSSFDVDMFLNTGDEIPLSTIPNLMETKVNCSLTGGAISIELENYYSIFYDDNWYIGRIIEFDKNSEMCKIKFLHETDVGFKWLSADDVQMMEKKFILSGPIQLMGNLPFHINYETRRNISFLYKNKKGLRLN
ncbi:hypothetical protein HNY73_007342 [Argiope bruennichi]|uniref:Uncharacterized protein n=1 Tax=Argiope bruennichi TaxID=94029 RepID=A0A8T0FG93_ARGBR|nr:hypothetical protein HNY73_007342 [Argiope bruennichi]